MFPFSKPKKSENTWLLAGLGNPGEKYAGNRHNIGFMTIDEIADRYHFPPFRNKFQSEMSEGMLAGEKVILLKPQTFMNNSGQAVKAAAKFFKIRPERVVVFHDELDLAAGKVRIKQGGGDAGHNGLRSVTSHLGTPDYWRARLGIGHPGEKSEVHSYVLRDFAKSERDWLSNLLSALAKHIELVAKNDMAAYMSKVAMDAPPPGSGKEEE